jgi:hypothetical protein
MSGWGIGFAVGGVVVLVVVVLLVTMIVYARRIAGTAEQILAALRASRDNTAALWKVQDTNLTTTRIVDGAMAARVALELQRKGVAR